MKSRAVVRLLAISVCMSSSAALMGAACAEPLVINPFPEKTKSSAPQQDVPPPEMVVEKEEMIPAQEEIVPTQPVEQVSNLPEDSSVLPAGIDVPKPDSAYFNAPADQSPKEQEDAEVSEEFMPTDDDGGVPSEDVFEDPELQALQPSPRAAPPPPPQRVMSGNDAAQDLSLTLEDIGERAIDPAAPFDSEPAKPYVPYGVEKRKKLERIQALDAESAEAPSAEESLQAPVSETAIPSSGFAAQPVSEPAVEPAPRKGLVYIRNGQISNNAMPAQDLKTSQSQMWEASQGASIRDILNQWSSQENVQLIWDNRSEFAVLQPLSLQGTYEEAVQALLDQYLEGHVRPLARLHKNPQNTQRTLVITVHDNS